MYIYIYIYVYNQKSYLTWVWRLNHLPKKQYINIFQNSPQQIISEKKHMLFVPSLFHHGENFNGGEPGKELWGLHWLHDLEDLRGGTRNAPWLEERTFSFLIFVFFMWYLWNIHWIGVFFLRQLNWLTEWLVTYSGKKWFVTHLIPFSGHWEGSKRCWVNVYGYSNPIILILSHRRSSLIVGKIWIASVNFSTQCRNRKCVYKWWACFFLPYIYICICLPEDEILFHSDSQLPPPLSCSKQETLQVGYFERNHGNRSTCTWINQWIKCVSFFRILNGISWVVPLRSNSCKRRLILLMVQKSCTSWGW